jgi:hypothetical protein
MHASDDRGVDKIAEELERESDDLERHGDEVDSKIDEARAALLRQQEETAAPGSSSEDLESPADGEQRGD